MADHDEDDERDESPEQPQRLFTLKEAEQTRKELEPFLVEAIGTRKKLNELEQDLAAISTRSQVRNLFSSFQMRPISGRV